MLSRSLFIVYRLLLLHNAIVIATYTPYRTYKPPRGEYLNM